MMDRGLAGLRHLERLAEMEAIAREAELIRAAHPTTPARPVLASVRRRIGRALLRAGERLAAGAGS